MKKIIVRGPCMSSSGYGEQARFALRALRAHEDKFDIFIDNINWGQTGWIYEDNDFRKWLDYSIGKTMNHIHHGGGFDVALQITIPNEWQKLAPVNIGYTAGIETTKIAPVWVEKSNLMDKIIVISEHAKYGFDNTAYQAQIPNTDQIVEMKVTTPVEVVNYCARTGIEEEEINLDHIDTNFNFLSVAQWGPRKNLETTLIAFLEEFHGEGDVGLVLKISTTRSNIRDKYICENRLQQVLKNFPERKCKVYLLHGNLSEGEMKSLYRHPKINAFVTTTHGEGYGLPIFEATLAGLPVLAPDWSGQTDFLYAPQLDKKTRKKKNKAQFGKIAYDLQPVQPEAVWDGVIQADSQWAFARKSSTRELMRDVYRDTGKYLANAKRLQKHNEATFTEEVFNQEFVDALGLEFEDNSIEDWLKTMEVQEHE